jgi:hypothetical protein
LSEAWENQQVPPSIVNNNVGKSEDRSGVNVVNVQHGRTKDAERTVADETIMNNASNDTELVDIGEVGDESMHDAYDDAGDVDGDVGDKNMTVETSELNDQGDEAANSRILARITRSSQGERSTRSPIKSIRENARNKSVSTGKQSAETSVYALDYRRQLAARKLNSGVVRISKSFHLVCTASAFSCHHNI